jgi:hypothetical protein
VKGSVDVMQPPEGCVGRSSMPVHRTQVCEQSDGIHVVQVGMICVGFQWEPVHAGTPGITVERPLVVDVLKQRLQRRGGKAENGCELVLRRALLQESDRSPLRCVEAWINFVRHLWCPPSTSVLLGVADRGNGGPSRASRGRDSTSGNPRARIGKNPGYQPRTPP